MPEKAKGRPRKDDPLPSAPAKEATKPKANCSSEPALAELPEPVRKAREAGWSVVPQFYDHGSKRPYFKWGPYQERQATAQELISWHQDCPEAMWAVVTGQISGFIVLDFDGEEGNSTLERSGLSPNIRTPSGSLHVYVRAPEWPVKGGPRVDMEQFPGMDLQGDGQLATFYGKNPEGTYKRVGKEPYTLDGLPADLRDLVLRRDKSRKPSDPVVLPEGFEDFLSDDELLIEALAHVEHGQGRNAAGFWLACQLRDERYGREQAQAVMMEYTRRVASVGGHAYPQQEAYNTLVSAYSAPPRAPRRLGLVHFPRTDYGNAERLVARHGDDLRYCHPWKSWLVWDSRRWMQDDTGEVDRRAKETTRAMRTAAASLDDPELAKSC